MTNSTGATWTEPAPRRWGGPKLADLRAYKERTEAGLVDLSQNIRDHGVCPACHKIKDLGLWRDPPQAEAQP